MPFSQSGGSGGGGLIPAAQISATPPAGPTDGMIWIYPADATNGVNWQFVYNSSETTYKWRFVGGSPWFADVVPNSVVNTNTQVAATGYYYAPTSAYTIVRAGDYMVFGSAAVDSNGGAAAAVNLGPFHQSSQGGFMRGAVWVTTVNTAASLTASTRFTGLAVNDVLGLSVNTGVNGTYKLVEQQVNVLPVRVI